MFLAMSYLCHLVKEVKLTDIEDELNDMLLCCFIINSTNYKFAEHILCKLSLN